MWCYLEGTGLQFLEWSLASDMQRRESATYGACKTLLLLHNQVIVKGPKAAERSSFLYESLLSDFEWEKQKIIKNERMIVPIALPTPCQVGSSLYRREIRLTNKGWLLELLLLQNQWEKDLTLSPLLKENQFFTIFPNQHERRINLFSSNNKPCLATHRISK